MEEAEEVEGYRALPLPMEPLLTLVLEKDKRKLVGDLSEKAGWGFEGGGVHGVEGGMHRDDSIL